LTLVSPITFWGQQLHCAGHGLLPAKNAQADVFEFSFQVLPRCFAFKIMMPTFERETSC
jgi:hypothetical protein